MKKCKTCGETNKDNAKFCIKCGEQFSNFIPLCPDCKNVVTPDDVFCNKCGKRIIESDLKQETAKKATSKYIEKPVVITGRNRNFKIFIGLIGGFAAVAVIVLLLVFVIDIGNLTNPSKSITEVKYEEEENEQIVELSKEELSSDQIRVISLFGYPDFFTVAFDEAYDNKRMDIWIYFDMEALFVFENGTYNNSEQYYGEKSQESEYEVLPQDFIYGMTPIEVETLIGEKGTESFEEDTGYGVMTFGGGEIICIFSPDSGLIIASRQNKLSNET